MENEYWMRRTVASGGTGDDNDKDDDDDDEDDKNNRDNEERKQYNYIIPCIIQYQQAIAGQVLSFSG